MAVFNPEVQEAPACILWPDGDRQWEPVIPRLQRELPELLVLGNYQPDKRTGPAIWLRCVIAGEVDPQMTPMGADEKTTRHQSEEQGTNNQAESAEKPVPIIYLPGVSRQDLRAVESCPDFLKPLAELQYRGAFWSQLNAKDWTLYAFLKSPQGGLGLDVAGDKDTRHAIQLALPRLLDEGVDGLRGKHLDKDVFNTLLTGGDPVKELLLWLDQGDAFRDSRAANEWQAFVELCKSQFAFDPVNEGILAGVAKLAAHSGPWQPVWHRFGEAPHLYPHLPQRLRQCQMPPVNLLSDAQSHGAWPQWNEQQEQELRQALLEMANVPPHQARQRLAELEHRHGPRRQLVWAALGEADLARALEHLAVLAQVTAHSIALGSITDMASTYHHSGWRADDALLHALAVVSAAEDVAAVTAAIRAVYQPWAEEAAHQLQTLARENGYPNADHQQATAASATQGECFLFVDGLRFHLARRLAESLTGRGYTVAESPWWAPLPSLTATGKPAVSPVSQQIQGADLTGDFEPCVAKTQKSLKGGYHFRKLLDEAGCGTSAQLFPPADQAVGWCEAGDIDTAGHQWGSRLALEIPKILSVIEQKVARLLELGWAKVRVVTDHGWLLLPGGLPSTKLSSDLVETKWGRCACIKAGAITTAQRYPWYWNPAQSVALADGISCYRQGEEYAHGGLSLQECYLLQLEITRGSGAAGLRTVTIAEIVWRGLRCTVQIQGEGAGLQVDLRRQPGNAASSVVQDEEPRPVKADGSASVLVPNEELEGEKGFIVILDEEQRLVAQAPTVIGGEEA